MHVILAQDKTKSRKTHKQREDRCSADPRKGNPFPGDVHGFQTSASHCLQRMEQILYTIM